MEGSEANTVGGLMTKTIDQLPEDIAEAFHKGAEIKEEHLEAFKNTLGSIIVDRLTPKPEEAPKLRMSKIGTPDRKAWYEFNLPIPRSAYRDDKPLKFVFGDIIEALLILMAKVTGHEVTDEQKEVTVNGVVGHKDFRLNGVTVDAKSASPYGFKKFKDGSLYQNDSFGYAAQLSGYLDAEGDEEGAFIAVDKSSGEIAILPLQKIDRINSSARIDRLREVIKMPEPPPEKCYPAEPYGKSGNMTLNANCGFCAYKHRCWADANGGRGLRGFKYANGVTLMTEVVNEPRVEEVDLSAEKAQD